MKVKNDELTQKIIGCAMKVHSALGPGLLESCYEKCLVYELEKVGLMVRSQVDLPVHYDGKFLGCGYRVDLLVEEKIILEIKSVQEVAAVHVAQLITYLRLSKKATGLLINFNVNSLKEGIRRIMNNHDWQP